MNRKERDLTKTPLVNILLDQAAVSLCATNKRVPHQTMFMELTFVVEQVCVVSTLADIQFGQRT